MNRAFAAWWHGLSSSDRASFAGRVADHAFAQGVYVTGENTKTPIPVVLSPSVVADAQLASLSRDAGLILSGLIRLVSTLLRSKDPRHQQLCSRLFDSFLPLERAAVEKFRTATPGVSTARLDFLVDRHGRAKALEVNATIPAMQGYSDGMAHAFIEGVAEATQQRAIAEEWIASNRRNSDELLESLLAHYERLGGERRSSLRIPIVSRAGDSQLGELEHYVARWRALGHDVWLATPDDVRLVGDQAEVSGKKYDLLYRHIFAKRLDPNSDFARICLNAERFFLFNSISSHLEAKALLALLSIAVDEKDGGLALQVPFTADEAEAVNRSVPWTRILHSHSERSPDGHAVAGLANWVKAEPDRVVLKKSWDYGGKSVFLGRDFSSADEQRRVHELFPAWRGRKVAWTELVDAALADPDPWVVQEFVEIERQPCLRVEGGQVLEEELYFDLSAYTNWGVDVKPTGGAVRASKSRIVNILGGGGLAPLLRQSVVDKIFTKC